MATKYKVVLKGCLTYEFELDAPDQDTAVALAKQQLFEQGIEEVTIVSVEQQTTTTSGTTSG